MPPWGITPLAAATTVASPVTKVHELIPLSNPPFVTRSCPQGPGGGVDVAVAVTVAVADGAGDGVDVRVDTPVGLITGEGL